MTIGGEFPYLVGNLIAMPMLALAWFAAGPQRRAMVASGALCTPLGALSIVLDEYWLPRRIGGLPLGVEDFLFSFQAGASAWFWGSLPFRHRLVAMIDCRRMFKRASSVAAGFAVGLAMLWAGGMSGPAPIFLASLVIVTIAVAWRPRLWRFAAATAMFFTGSYVVLLWALFAMVPGLAGEWPSGPQWTEPLLGLPVGEYVWALVGAPAHVLCFCYIAQADLLESARVLERDD